MLNAVFSFCNHRRGYALGLLMGTFFLGSLQADADSSDKSVYRCGPHLYCAPGVQVLSTEPRIFFVENFLSAEECDYLMEVSLPHLEPSPVVVDNANIQDVGSERTSKGMFHHKEYEDPIVRKIDFRIADLLKIPDEYGEALYVLRYEEGGQYLPHYDFFDPATEGGAFCLERGGQRIATVIMYLTDTEAGGATYFPEADIQIEPIKGNAVIFYNCTPEGVEDPMALHAGEPVLKGEKWIATKWIRARNFYHF